MSCKGIDFKAITREIKCEKWYRDFVIIHLSRLETKISSINCEILILTSLQVLGLDCKGELTV